MGKKMNVSRKDILASSGADFIDQRILSYDEICSFDDDDIKSLKTVGTFSNEVFFKPFDPKSQPDLASLSWLYFSGYLFGLGLKYPFPRVISRFFEITQISYIQAMPIVWRVLF